MRTTAGYVGAAFLELSEMRLPYLSRHVPKQCRGQSGRDRVTFLPHVELMHGPSVFS